MKAYQIMLFVFIFNFTLQIVLNLDLFGAGMGSIECPDGSSECWGVEKFETAEEQLETTIETQGWFSELNWLVENVRLSFRGLSIFFGMFLGATILPELMLKNIIGAFGGSIEGAAMWGLVELISWLIRLVYIMGITQFMIGRSMRDIQ